MAFVVPIGMAIAGAVSTIGATASAVGAGMAGMSAAAVGGGVATAGTAAAVGFGASAASFLGSAALGIGMSSLLGGALGKPKIPSFSNPSAPTPAASLVDAQAAANERRRTSLLSGGLVNPTGGSGSVLQPSQTTKKTLLGQ